MELFKNKTVAWIITVLVIIISISLNSVRTYGRWKSDAEKVFYAKPSVQDDLDKRVELSYNLIAVGNKYVEQMKDSGCVTALQKARDNLMNAETILDKYQYNSELTAAYTAVYGELKVIALLERDTKYREDYYIDLNELDMLIRQSGYNEGAYMYNERLQKDMGAVLKTLGIMKPLAIFD